MIIQIFDYIFPACCPVCLEPVMPKGQKIHDKCRKRLRTIEGAFCMKCGRAISHSEREFCGDCQRSNRSFESGRCTFEYHSGIERALKNVKENGTRELVDFLAETTAKHSRLFLASVHPEAIVPVPIHRTKLLWRGYNQSELLADALSKYTGIPVRKILCKERRTKDQKGLNRFERQRNLLNAFGVRQDGKELPKTVLLIDDIFTTGSTIDACSKILKRSGVEKVHFIAMAAGTGNT